MDTQEPEDEYIPLKDAAEIMHYTSRHLKRFIAAGELKAKKPNRNTIWISKSSIKAYHEKHGMRLIDPAEKTNERISRLELALGEAFRQIAEQKAEIAVLKAEVTELKSVHHRQVAELLEEIRHRPDQRTHKKARQSPVERRGLPTNWERLTTFANKHGVKENILRSFVRYDSTLVSLVRRPTATTYLHEWWLSGGQQVRILALLQTQNITYTPCSNCPHQPSDSEENARGLISAGGTNS
ncbi:MAG TPA: hypothetical protein VFN35_21135 [Ktedonobacteraceae bacterium]|nr:hypothetical protein [Ktedonobacteraceae bacterium]